MTRAHTWLLDGDQNPLAPSSVVADLQAINPRLGLNYHIAMRVFMVTLKWPENDPRREMIQRGEMSPDADFEILCPVPVNVSLDELTEWVRSQLVRVGNSREDVKRMVAENEARAAAQNAAVLDNAKAEATEELMRDVTNPAPKHGRRRTRVRT